MTDVQQGKRTFTASPVVVIRATQPFLPIRFLVVEHRLLQIFGKHIRSQSKIVMHSIVSVLFDRPRRVDLTRKEAGELRGTTSCLPVPGTDHFTTFHTGTK